MIASIKGVVMSKDGNRIIVGIGGVGLEVHVPFRKLDDIGGVGDTVRLQTYLHVKEDALTLYGFLEESDRRLFQALLGVSGIGPKVGLAILSVCEAGELARLIHREDTKAIQAFPGVGRKTAERIVLELRDKIDVEYFLPAAGVAVPSVDRGLLEEAVSALVGLGLTRANAGKALERVRIEDLGESFGVEDIVREALKQVSSKRKP
jgi:Holliday junction DNA helicase RuvA